MTCLPSELDAEDDARITEIQMVLTARAKRGEYDQAMADAKAQAEQMEG